MQHVLSQTADDNKPHITALSTHSFAPLSTLVYHSLVALVCRGHRPEPPLSPAKYLSGYGFPGRRLHKPHDLIIRLDQPIWRNGNHTNWMHTSISRGSIANSCIPSLKPFCPISIPLVLWLIVPSGPLKRTMNRGFDLNIQDPSPWYCHGTFGII